MNRIVRVLLLGATAGLKLFEFGPEGTRELANQKPWWIEKAGLLCWPMGWITGWLRDAHEGLGQGDIITGAGWGADVALMDDPRRPIMALHYACLKPWFERTLAGRDPYDIHCAIGGANVAHFMSWVNLSALQTLVPKGRLGAGSLVIPVLDMMSWQNLFYSEHLGHEPSVLHNLGLESPEARALTAELAGWPELGGQIAPYQPWGENQLIEDAGGICLVPFKHDTTAVMGAFGTEPGDAIISSGTWNVVGRPPKTDSVPTRKSFEAGIAFEGAGSHRRVIQNVAEWGRLWKGLVQGGARFMSYSMAAESALRVFPQIRDDTNRLMAMPKDPDELWSWLRENADAIGDQPFGLVAASCAYRCILALQAITSIFGLEKITRIFLAGGWGLNDAFREALTYYAAMVLGGEVELVVVPHPEEATAYAVAGAALLAAGDARTMTEAVEMLPPLVK